MIYNNNPLNNDQENNQIPLEQPMQNESNNNSFQNQVSSENNEEIENNPNISNQTRNDHLKIFKNQSFDSYREFETHFNKYQYQSKQLFIVTNSSINENEDQPNFRVFKCIHYKDKPISNNNKIRPLQNYNGKSCQAFIRVSTLFLLS
jgi:hypothetical protein